MNSSKDDLEDYVEKFRNIFYKQEECIVNKSDTWSLIENLTKELELGKEREDGLKNCLAKYVDSENAEITAKCVSLRERCEAFERENADLKNRLDDLQLQMTTEADTEKTEHLRRLNELEEKYKEEIDKFKEQIERDRVYYEDKERKLCDDLQLAQAKAALECDEIESNLKRQLVDANSKLRNSQNVIRSLQIDIHNLKNQIASQQKQAYYRSPKPEIKFQPLPINARISNQPVTYDDSETDDSEFFDMSLLPPARSATPSNTSVTSTSRSETPLNKSDTQQIGTPVVFRGSNKAPIRTVTQPASKMKKRRKLYDPNNFDETNMPTF